METKQWKDVLHIISGKNQKAVANPNGKYPIYGSGGIIGYADDYLCEAGTTIVGRKGTINKPIFVDEPFWNIDTAFGVAPGKNLNPKYLYYFCLYFNFMPLDKSTGRPSLAKSDLLKIKMPVPSLSKQEQIVKQIEESLSQLDSAVETLNQTKQQLEVYRQAVLRKCFDCGYETRKLKELCFFITIGTTPAKKELFSGHGEIPFVKVYNLTFSNKLDFSIDPTFVSNATHKGFLKRSITYPGDVLMNIVGPPMGKVSIVPHDYPEWNINQAIARFRCGEKLNNKFLAYYLGFSDTIKKLKSKSKATAGQFNLTLEICREIEIPLPNIEEQQRIADEIDNRLCICDIIIDTINQSLQQAEALRQSILKQAFEEDL